MYTIFATPGTFDLRSLDTFGLTAKPNSSNPIGYFGTGLKYALAVLLREGAKIMLYCNDDTYEFFFKEDRYRGVEYKQAFVERTNFKWSLERKTKELPFTSQLGRNWELWQAFRELYANTLDEGGEVWTTSEEVTHGEIRHGYTYIVIDHLEFSRLVDKKDSIFLPQERSLLIESDEGNVSPGRSKSIYYRGMRAMDLPEGREAMFTYNIIDQMELTEDRNLKSSYSVKSTIETMVERSEDPEFIETVLKAPNDKYESELNFQHAFSASPVFKEVLTKIRNHTGVNRSALSYYSSYVSPPKQPKCPDGVWLLIQRALDDAANELDKLPKLERPKIRALYLGALEKIMER